MLSGEKLAALIAKEQKNLESYKAKRDEYSEKIRRTEGKLQQYQMMQRSEKFNAVTAAVAQSGLSIEDVIAALSSGDLLGLQEKMEAMQVEDSGETVEDAEGDMINEDDSE